MADNLGVADEKEARGCTFADNKFADESVDEISRNHGEAGTMDGKTSTDSSGDDPHSSEQVKKMYRKLDLRIIPAFWVLYFLCSAIRSNIGLAQTMNRDMGHDIGTVLHMSKHDMSQTLTLYYVAYVVFDCPSNLIMTRLSPRVWMARIVLTAGVIGSCFTVVRAAWSAKLLRFLLGVVIAGMWPGMAYYLTLFYPPSRTAKRIGMYYSSAQISAAVFGLVSAGFQKMDGLQGLMGFQWMFLVYGLLAVVLGIALLWWLPDRPLPPGQKRAPSGMMRWLPQTSEVLKGADAVLHYSEMRRVYHPRPWTLRDLGLVLVDWRLWPLTLMYFGVVGVGMGIQLYGNVIIASINPSFSGVTISLLFAPIWLVDFCAILLVTPVSDHFHRHRALFFFAPVCVQIAGLLTVTFAPIARPWARYGGLLMLGFGLGPTLPVCMTWTGEIFQRRHREVGVAVASALVSGLGNLGSITTSSALYTGWEDDAKKGPRQYWRSNLVMVGILCVSIGSSLFLVVLLRIFGCEPSHQVVGAAADDEVLDGAARREQEQRRFGRFPWKTRSSPA